LALLQEINNRLRSQSGRIWSKFADLAYDATIGLAKQYQKKALELLKITAATCYVQSLKVFRKHLLLVFLLLFSVALLAVTAVVVPVAIILVSSWTPTLKATSIAVLGLFYCIVAAACLQCFFSEKNWMKASGFQELLDSIPTNSK
jgi:hypothetical protein